MDLSQLSDSDLKAYASGDVTKVSDAGLKLMARQSAPKSSIFKDAALGALKGATDIGSTLLTPVAAAANAIGGEGTMLTGDQRRKALQQFYADNANPDSLAFKGGELATGIAGTAGVGGAIAKGVRAIPALARAAPGLAAAIESGGFSLGGVPAATTAGQLAGNIATRLGGGAVAGGAAAGLINPSEITEGAAIGAAIPVVGKVAGELGRGAKAAFIDPLINKDKIVAAAIQRAVGPDNIQQTVAGLNRTPMTPGVQFSAGEASGNPALNALEDTFRATNPGGAMNARAQGNRVALAAPIRNLAQDELALQAAKDSRSSAADALYGMAGKSDLQRQELAAAQRVQQAGGIPQSAAGAMPSHGLQSLASRPAFKAAMQDASTSLENAGMGGTPLTGVDGLHQIKMSIDAALNGSAPNSGAARFDRASLQNIKAQLVKEIEAISPLYGNARKTFADMSQPINQMQVGQALSSKLLPATSGDIPASINAATFARALQNPDQVAKLATGFKASKLEDVLTPDQFKAVMGVNSDASRLAEMHKLGAGQGSATARRQALGSFIGDHFAEQAPGVNRIIEALGNVPGANYLTKGAAGIGNMLGSKINAGMSQQLESMLATDPQGVQNILTKLLTQQGQAAGNPRLEQLLRTAPVAFRATQASP